MQSLGNIDRDDVSVSSGSFSLSASAARSKSTTSKQSSFTKSLTPNPRPQNSFLLEGLTINKLNFASLGLYGRDREASILNGCLNELSSGAVERQLLLISGYSGTGKTALANTLQKPTQKLNGVYVKGKFDLNTKHEPYGGIILASTQICDHILSFKGDPVYDKICRRIKHDLGSELSLLLHFIPDLSELADITDGESGFSRRASLSDYDFSKRASLSSEQAKNQFVFAFQRFVRIVAEEFAPLIFVLDDLQWADGSSLDLIDALISDQKTSKIIILGIYRSNEVDQTHIFHRYLDSFREKSRKSTFQMTEISIGNLDMVSVHKIIGGLLSMETSERTLKLAEVCYEKTQGNIFFLLHFLSMMNTRNLLVFNFGLTEWTWDIGEIKAKMSVSDNVVDLLKGKILALSPDLILMLKVAACLGSTFHEQALTIVIEHLPGELLIEGGCADIVRKNLTALEQEGYIKQMTRSPTLLPSSSRIFMWTHDNIHETANSLVANRDEWSSFGYCVGKILYEQLDPNDLDNAVFVVANLLNQWLALGENQSPKSMDDEELLKVAALNYKASLRAFSLAAFESAASYAAIGIDLLPENRWTSDYTLSLGLYSIGAQSEGFLGNKDTMEHYYNEVSSLPNAPLEDKLLVYHTLVESHLAQGRPGEAADLIIEILSQFGCHFPKNPAVVALNVVSNVLRLKGTAKSQSVDELKELKDPRRLEMMKLVDKLATCWYMMHDSRLPLASLRTLKWTMRYGFSDFSSVAFSSAAMILTGVLDDLQGGSVFGKKALKLMEMSPTNRTHARTMLIVYAFVLPWTMPFVQMQKPLLVAYDIGMQCGDPETSTWAINMWLLQRFVSGTSLEPLEMDYRLYLQQMKSLGRLQQYHTTSYTRQVLLNLMGRNGSRKFELFGDGYCKQENRTAKEDPFHAPGFINYEGILQAYFGDHLRHADNAVRYGHDYLQKAYVCSPILPYDHCVKGVSCYVAATITKKRKYFKMAQKLHSKIKTWRENGNPNVKQYESLLDAEFERFRGKKYSHGAIQSYEAAISCAARAGFQYIAAYACERLGDFFLEVMEQKEDACYRIKQSIIFWREYGAAAKVTDLEAKYEHLMVQDK